MQPPRQITRTGQGDPQRDFDFFIGAWRVKHRRLRERLKASKAWEEFETTGETRPLWGGAATVTQIVGEFHSHELWEGRGIFVRNVWSDITPTSCRWEQAFSDDGGGTWETNWMMEFMRK